MLKVIRAYPTATKLFLVLSLLFIALSLASDIFFTLGNLTSLLNNNAVNVIWAVGLLVVLIAGGIDISFAVGASVVQYLCVYTFAAIGGGNWAVGLAFAALFGIGLGLINAYLIHQFRIISIVVTISTFNVFFGLLMFFSSGRFLYNLPSWWSRRVVLWEHQSADGSWADLTLPVAVMIAAMLATWFLIRNTTTGRQLYAFGDNPEGARRAGINIALMQAIAFGWCGMMGGIGGLMQAQVVKQVVPNALIGRELDVLAAVVLGGARLGGGRGSVLACFLGGVDPFGGFGRVLPVVVALIVLQVLTSGLNLLGANQHLSTAVWGLFLIGVMVLRWVAGRFGEFKRKKG